MSKKLLFVVVASLMILAFAIPAQAGTPVVMLDGNALTFDVPPVVEDGRTLVPMRAIFEALGATVEWEDATQTVTAKKGDVTVKLAIGGAALVNDKEVALDVPAKLVNDRTLVPLRFVSESLGAKVDWTEETETVTITSPTAAEEPATDQAAPEATVEEPAAGQTADDQATVEEPAADQTADNQATVEEPAADQTADDQTSDQATTDQTVAE